MVTGKELKELGFNLNFAPVVDVNSNPKNPVIGVRSFSNDANVVSKNAVAFMDALHSCGIAATAKHFPGHGDTVSDSHFELPVILRTKSELENLELIPFKEMIKNGVDVIMSAHIAMPNIDSTKVISKKTGEEICLPATLSKKILTGIFKEELNFKGVVMTDSMGMKAISENFGDAQAVTLAVDAGADLIVVCMLDPQNSERQREEQIDVKLKRIYDAIESGVEEGTISIERINKSTEKVLGIKAKYCV